MQFYMILILIWESTYRIFVEKWSILPKTVYTSPLKIISNFKILNEDSFVVNSLISSLERLFIGFFIALIIGIFLGFIVSKYEYLRTNIKSLILALQTLPNVAWVPISVLLFGLTNASILFTIIIGSVFALIIATEEGINNINPIFLKAAQTMGASGKKLYLHVIFPAALPTIIIGMKQAWSFAWRALIAGEMLAGKNGLGYILMDGKSKNNISQITMVLVIIIILGVLFENLIFGKIERVLKEKWGLNKA